MLHHISVAVNDPMHVGQVIAEVMNGQLVPFPPHPGSYMVLAGDEYGTGIELYPSGTELVPGQVEATFAQKASSSQFNSVHAAISVAMSQAQIEAIGQREGWLVRLCDRGPFEVIEFWVENKLMLELLPPVQAEKYLNFLKPENWQAFVEMADSMDLAERHHTDREPVNV